MIKNVFFFCVSVYNLYEAIYLTPVKTENGLCWLDFRCSLESGLDLLIALAFASLYNSCF